MGFTTLVLEIDSVAIAASKIHGMITISRKENEAATMEVTLIPGAGLQDIDDWAGQTVELTIDSVIAFTGVVDMPVIDVVYKRITLVCSDNRKEILNAQTIAGVGFYSDSIFSETENTIEELDQRLTTIPSAADIKPNGVYAITDIRPAITPSFTLTDADIYRRTPEVSPTSRSRLVNQIVLNYQHRYVRLRHRERSFKIGNHSFCDHAETVGSKYTRKTTFYEYMNAMNWHLNESTVVFEDVPPSGIISSCAIPTFLWYNMVDVFALWVEFDSATRFAQTITEEFTLTIKAPQSIAQYGTIEWEQDNGLEIEYDASNFEAMKSYISPTGMTFDANDYYADQDSSVDFDDSVLCAINIANTKIIKSHRDTQVNFETALRLDFDLTQTIELSTNILDAKGKVTSIDHFIDITNRRGETTTEISLSTAQGAQTPDSLTAPSRPTVSVDADSFSDPIQINLDIYGEGDIETPAIDNTSRDEQIETASQTYEIEIQNDTFGVTF